MPQIDQITEALSQGEPLKAIDFVIQVNHDDTLTKKQQREYKKLVMLSLLAVAGQETKEDDDVEGALLEILDNYHAMSSSRLVAVCLLRLLPEPSMRWLTNKTWRPRVVTFLDSQFSDDLYRNWKIDENEMSHEKVPQLIQSVKDLENDFRKTTQSLTSLDRIKAHRQSVMAAVNRKGSRPVIMPFLPDNLESQLGELYVRVLEYLDKQDSLEVLEVYEDTVQEIKRFIQINEAWGTVYSNMLASRMGKRLLTFIEADFANNKVAQPATVKIRIHEKKYPFHAVGQEIALGFIVNNEGPGYAYDTTLTLIADDCIKLFVHEVELGRLAPSVSQLVEIPATVTQPSDKVDLALELKWRDFNARVEPREYFFQIEAQRSDIDWDRLARRDPYSLEPVVNEQELVGRKEALNDLVGTLGASRIGSALIYGQKRVGKTSIARALESYLQASNYLVVYLEGGDYVDPNPRVTISRLGQKLCTRLKRLVSRIEHVESPEFDEALSPLTDFLDSIEQIAPDLRIVFILDEFDELPFDLYSRGPLGDAFFLTLRSISSRANVGFVLVGGEKMLHILDCQGKHLNKWKAIPVDYFNRETDWTDYKELIQRPVTNSIEYSGDALVALHEITSGNPYFTKLICGYIFRKAVQRRDCHVTREEVDESIEIAVGELSINTFQHFWEDGIFETGRQATEKSIRRRKILIATSDILNAQLPATIKKIAEHPLAQDIVALESELTEFATRKILTCNMQHGTYEFKVLLFYKWLKNRGVHEVIATFSDLDAALRERQAEEAQKIQPVEIVELVNQWGIYKGQKITEDKVRVWLDQYGKPGNQRAMLKILQGLRFYSNETIRLKMKEVDSIVRRGLTHHREHGKLKRSDIVVSYLDGPGKSGAHFARLYADEASIYVGNVVEKAKLSEYLQSNSEIQALVFIDDFVGTGHSASEYLKQADQELNPVIESREIKVVFVAVIAYIDGWSLVEETAEALDISVQVHTCEILDESARCFGDNSAILRNVDERAVAKDIALTQGKLLEKKCPLGYGNLELAVVFEHGCPNNSLPILWSESTGKIKWRPLFKRL